jgi:hypothetical protein
MAEDRGPARSSLCAQQARFAERTGQKACPRLDRGSFSSVSSPILACSNFTSTAGAVSAEQPGGTVKHLRLPRRDLVRMNVVRLCQLGQRLLTLDGQNARTVRILQISGQRWNGRAVF